MSDQSKPKDLPELPSSPDRVTADLTALLHANRDKLGFTEVQLQSMDENTKKILLEDVREALGIEPLQGEPR